VEHLLKGNWLDALALSHRLQERTGRLTKANLWSALKLGKSWSSGSYASFPHNKPLPHLILDNRVMEDAASIELPIELQSRRDAPFKSHLEARLLIEQTPYQIQLDHSMSRAFGIQSRYPFLDRRLVDLGLQSELGQYCEFGQNKSVLRQALKNDLPKHVNADLGKWGRPGSNLLLLKMLSMNH
jgi:asparagine synthetase B (glutamine-hydrolysing)